MEPRQIVRGRLPGPERGEDSVASRGRSPIGLTAPGSGAKDEIKILSVEFVSDHKVLLDYTKDWEDGGVRFPKPEWPEDGE